MNVTRKAPLNRRASSRLYWLAPGTIMIGSLVTLLPIIPTIPILPPFGLMLFIAWRLLRPDLLPPWGAALLGLFDDSISGQPMGSAMMLWTLCYFTVDVIDTRLVYRDFWHNWLIGAGAIGAALVAGRLLATPLGAHVDTALLIQIFASVALFPVVMQWCMRIDRRTRPR